MDNEIPVYRALSVVSAEKRGSSRPIVVETEAGYFLTKLRGAAQGPSALVAEVVVAAIAELLGLWVPCQVLIHIDAETQRDIHEDEFLDLFAASQGLNLGFQYLEGAIDVRPDQIGEIDDDLASQVLWLDALVMNVDRTIHNPNLMLGQEKLWLIDHGAALPFQYNWAAVREASPRREYPIKQHIFCDKVHLLKVWDQRLTHRLSFPLLREVMAKIPVSFLPPRLGVHQLERRRLAYAAFLWKRLKFPRPYMNWPFLTES